MGWRVRFCLGMVLLLVVNGAAAASSLTKEQVPEPLQPWIAWALHGQEEAACPTPYNRSDDHRCLWAGELSLSLERESGAFAQSWQLFAKQWVPLPGGPGQWPINVKVDGRPALLETRGETPGTLLSEGEHRIEGQFAWKALPESLAVPSPTGIVRLNLEGDPVLFPNLDSKGRLWLKSSQKKDPAIEERLQLQVFRKLVDEIPFTLHTRLVLSVSGQARELLLGQALPDNFAAAKLSSPLPVRIEADGRLRVQVRPGQWNIDLVAHHQGPLSALRLAPPGEPWAESEVWVFDARPTLRLVTPEGLTPVDPQQTTLPGPWKKLPAFLVHPGDVLRMTEKRRGDPDPVPDQLSLHRTLWLDFDGGGYTIRDRISGSMTRRWRLELRPPGELGRVAVDGVDRFITQREGGLGAGVEVRRGDLDLVADSRLEKRTASIPAVGWAQNFSSVQGTLNLPPGWRLLYASGADQVPGTWLTRWSLLDLFVVLLAALAVGRLWNWPWGILTLVTLALAYHEPGAPRWVWLHILAATALVRAFPPGRGRSWARMYRGLSLLALALILIPFMINHVRTGLYPQLERAWATIQSIPHSKVAAPQDQEGIDAVMRSAEAPLEESARELKMAMKSAPATEYMESRRELQDPNAAVQTGPGLPQWNWRSVSLRWNGPVASIQQLRLILLSPPINLFLAIMRVLLLAALAWRVVNHAKDEQDGKKGNWRFFMVPLFLCLSFTPSGQAQAEIPGPELLKSLQERLLAPAECYPFCATFPELQAEYSSNELTLDLTIHSSSKVAVPLPGQNGHWVPQQIQLNGKPARLFRDPQGVLWLPVSKGQHQLRLKGPLPKRDTVALPLALRPERVSAKGQGWTLEGLKDDGTTARQLQLRRIVKDGEKSLVPLEPTSLPSYFRVERTLHLGLNWQISTRVVRVFDAGGPAVIRVPLLKGEAVTTDNLTVKENEVTLNIPPEIRELRWHSIIDPQKTLRLKAANREQWSESWKLDVSPIWHVETDGIPVIHHQDTAGNWLPQWRPWPGEEVTLDITRPKGIPGQTLTIDDSQLTVKPGSRIEESQLNLTIRSSRGGQHSLTLPNGAELQSVSINGAAQPIRQEDRTLTLPLVPGRQSAQIKWRSPIEGRALLRTPEVNVGVRSVNGRLRMEIPRDRWVLFTGGPRLGPAVLFWGVVLVLLPIAAGLGRVSLTPLRFHHWLLLGLGLTQLHMAVAVLIVGWLLALGARERVTLEGRDWGFNFLQIGLGTLSVMALLALVNSVKQGLLGYPEMQIIGNGSSAYLLNWFADRCGNLLPQAWALTVPMFVYRLLMLAWALWLALALLRWLQWGWRCFSKGGLWRPVKVRKSLRMSEPPAVKKN